MDQKKLQNIKKSSLKKILLAVVCLTFSFNFLYAESRFGDLTEMRDERMRGKDGKWVRPHPGPLFGMELKKNKEFSLGKKQINMFLTHKITIKKL